MPLGGCPGLWGVSGGGGSGHSGCDSDGSWTRWMATARTGSHTHSPSAAPLDGCMVRNAAVCIAYVYMVYIWYVAADWPVALSD